LKAFYVKPLKTILLAATTAITPLDGAKGDAFKETDPACIRLLQAALSCPAELKSGKATTADCKARFETYLGVGPSLLVKGPNQYTKGAGTTPDGLACLISRKRHIDNRIERLKDDIKGLTCASGSGCSKS